MREAAQTNAAKPQRVHRVPVMLSQAELDTIDDWRFTNRVATRSETIRRLCRMAVARGTRLSQEEPDAIR